VNIKWRKVVSSSKEVATTVASISVNPLGGGAVIPSDPVKRRPAIIESIVRDVAADYNVTLKPSIVKDTLTLPSATYHDNTAVLTRNSTTNTNTSKITTSKQQQKEPASDMVMHKIIDFSSFSITVASSPLSADRTVVSADGHAQVNLRVFQNSHNGTIFHDVSVAIHQQWQIIPFENSFIGSLPPNQTSHHYQHQKQQPSLLFIQRLISVFSSISNDNTSRLTAATKARKLVKQNEVKGGILIPSNSTGSALEYDAFFDCTDRSFSVYLSLVRPDTHENHSSSTRTHFHLTEVTVLIPTCCSITFGDLSMTGSTSDQESIYAIEIGHLALDTISTGTHNSMIRFIEVS
jgi:hypothetical protein